MLQFTSERLAALRERAAAGDGIAGYLRERVRPVKEHFRVPATGIATWSGFYACPRHSVELRFDIEDPHRYVCPVDGEIFTGAPYEGAWWRILNGMNATACHESALLWLIGGGREYFDLSRRLLTDYAACYPGYEVHGGIPYNNPGKANAQTLCDAMWIKGLMLGYDLIRGELSEEDRRHIEENLLRPCGEFLMQYRAGQIHNHETISDSSVAMLGLLLNEPRFIEFGLEEKYGLRYQLAHGVLEDGFWFEGTPGYHFFAMEQYLCFELFARDTPRSFFRDPRFAEILKFPLRLLQPDGKLPRLNDWGHGNPGFRGTENIYELAYAITGDEDFAQILHLGYGERARDNLYAFFFGAEKLPPKKAPAMRDYHCAQPGGSGLTVLNGPDGRQLLFKHSPFGGEHDHYDRLGLSFIGLGQYIAPDLGTSQYGAPLHYAYYKNTLSHNTVCLDGENQPPANCETLRYLRGDGRTLCDARVCWDGSYRPLDSFTIPQWSEAAYAGARLRRVIVWYGDFFIDLFQVTAPEERVIDWSLHVHGARVTQPGEKEERERWTEKGAGSYLRGVQSAAPGGPWLQSRWLLGGGSTLTVHTLRGEGTGCFYAAGPDNPSIGELSYLLERRTGTQALFVNVFCAERADAPVLREVRGTVEDGRVRLRLLRADGSTAELDESL